MTSSAFVGRKEELASLEKLAEKTLSRNGQTVFIGGKAGIGKTRLTQEFATLQEAKGFRVLKGLCLPNSFVPLLPFKEALRGGGLHQIAMGGNPPRILQLYLIDNFGILMAQHSRESEDLDSDIFAGMLTAVENFVSESLTHLKKGAEGGLKSMNYGNYGIVLEHGQHLNFVAIIEGQENEFLRHDMRLILKKMEDEHCEIITNWEGDMKDMAPLKNEMRIIVESRKYDGVDYTGDDPRLKQENLFDNILLGLQREAGFAPLLLILDDLQWSEPTTLNLLHYIARNTKNDRLMIIGTYRPEDLISTRKRRHHPFKLALDNMAKEELYEEINLESIKDMRIFVNGILKKHTLSDSFIERLNKETDGNPFFIIEFTRLLQETAQLVQDESGEWSLAVAEEDVKVPSKLFDVIRNRLARLHEEQLSILESASVVGDEFESRMISQIRDVHRIKLLRNLSDIEKLHNVIAGKGPSYRFDHAKIREVLYADLPNELRMDYHLVIGETYEKLFANEKEPIFDKLAQHFHKAKDPRAIIYGRIAGDEFRKEYANEEAIAMYDIALEIMGESDELKLEVLEAKGEVHILAGNFEQAIECFNDILDSTNDPEAKARCHWNIGTALVRTGKFHQSQEELLKGLPLLKKKGELYGKLLIQIAYTHSMIGNYEDGIKAAKEATSILEGLDDVNVDSIGANRMEAYNAAALGQWDYSENIYISLLDSIDEKMHWEIASTHNNLGQVQAYTGRLKDALISFEKGAELMELVGDKRHLAVMTTNYCWILKEMGRFEETADILEDNLLTVEKINDIWTKALIYGNHIDANIRQERFEKAHLYDNKAREVMKIIGDTIEVAVFGYLTSALLTAEGKLEDGEKKARDSMAIAKEHKMQRVIGMCKYHLAQNLRAQGRLAEAEKEYYDALELQADQRLEGSRSLLGLGLTEIALGQVDEGKKKVKDALAEFEDMGAKWDADRARKALDG